MYKLFLSLRYLRSHKIIYFSIAGVAMGIFVMVGVTSVMGGFSRDIRARIRGMQSDLVVAQADPTVFLINYQELCRRIRAVPGVKGCAPRIEWEAWLQHKGSYRTVKIVGIDPEQEKGLSKLEMFFRAGGKRSFDFLSDRTRERIERGVVIGTEFPYPGLTQFTLTSVRPNGGVYNKEFEVLGYFKSGMAEYDHAVVFMDLKDAQEFLRLRDQDAITTISIALENYERDLPRVRAEIIEVMHRYALENKRKCTGAFHPYGRCSYYQTQTWEEAKKILLQAVSVEKGIQIFILFFIVLVAGFNILAIYTLVVRAKTRDIGILRALGATRGGVIVVFLLSGMACGLVGSLIGIGSGLLFSNFVNEIATVIELSSREFNQLPGMTKVLAESLAALATLSFAVTFLFFYKRERTWILPAGLVSGLLVAAAAWVFLSWLSPHDDCYFRWPEKPIPLRLPISLGAGAVPVLFVLLREPVRKLRWDWPWILVCFLATLAFAGLSFLILVASAVGGSVLALQPHERWPGLELFPRDVYYLDRIPVYIDEPTLALIVVFTLIVSLICSIYPALRAAASDPIEALRDE